MERSSERFSRRFRLSKNGKVEEVKGAMENGVLTMVVKIPIWILRSYDFTISPTQNDLNLSRIFAVVQDR